MTLPQWHGFVDPLLLLMSDGQIRRNVDQDFFDSF